MTEVRLIRPSLEALGGFADACRRGWSRDNVGREKTARADLERIAAAFDGFVSEAEATGCRGGCPFGNLAIELADVHEDFRLRLSEAFRSLSRAFAGLVEDAQARGQVRPDADAAALGDFLVAAIEGGILLAKVHRSCEPLRATLREAEARLSSYRTGA